MAVRKISNNSSSRFRVIRIMSDMSILLNCGKNDGIKLGDQFRILSEETEKIVDPFSNEILGVINKYKAEIEVTQVYDKMCICQNAHRSGSMADLAMNISRAYSLGSRRRLNVDPGQISGGFSANSDDVIQIGDEVEPIPQIAPSVNSR